MPKTIEEGRAALQELRDLFSDDPRPIGEGDPRAPALMAVVADLGKAVARFIETLEAAGVAVEGGIAAEPNGDDDWDLVERTLEENRMSSRRLFK